MLFKSFLDANSANEFLIKPSNFKVQEKNNFSVKWFKEEEDMKGIPESLKAEFHGLIIKANENLLKNQINKSNSFNNPLPDSHKQSNNQSNSFNDFNTLKEEKKENEKKYFLCFKNFDSFFFKTFLKISKRFYFKLL